MANQYIEKLSCWRKDNPRKAKGASDYARLLNWLRKDVTIERATPKPAPIIEEAEQNHRAEILFRTRLREGWSPNSLELCRKAIKELDAERGL